MKMLCVCLATVLLAVSAFRQMQASPVSRTSTGSSLALGLSPELAPSHRHGRERGSTGFSLSSNRFGAKRSESWRYSHRSNNLALRGGFSDTVSASLTQTFQSPSAVFNGLLLALAAATVVWKVALASFDRSQGGEKEAKPAGVKSLQLRFLAVFWLMRMADWLQGPYFYEVYSSKILNGMPVSLDLVSKLFLVGFATTGIFGPWIGSLVDTVGRRAGTIAYAVLYAIGALSTRSSLLNVLLLGRVAGGLGTSLLFSAPEAWLVGEHQKEGYDGKWLGQTFGWAYAGDSLVAITAGQLAALTAAQSGPSGPFTLSVGFLIAGSLLAMLKWRENVAPTAKTSSPEGNKSPSIGDGLSLVLKDKRIMLLGAVQALFEGAMYIFVLQWPPAIQAAIQNTWGANTAVPFGNIFSCFMASCLLGSTLFGTLQKKNVSVEKSTPVMLFLATAAMATATAAGSKSFVALTAAMFLFEACVGMYFPSIGTLRSKFLPDSHRSVIMNLFGIPLNLIVVTVFLSIRSLGVQGALSCASAALAIASLCMTVLSNSDTQNSSK